LQWTRESDQERTQERRKAYDGFGDVVVVSVQLDGVDRGFVAESVRESGRERGGKEEEQGWVLQGFERKVRRMQSET
jgi:hypothetical protein